MKRLIPLIGIVLLLVAIPLLAQTRRPAFAVEDQWQEGCISCHSAAVMGQTLDVALEKNDHPSIGRIVAALPEGCTNCHSDGTLAPLVHRSHYRATQPAGGPTMACLACHTMDARTGRSGNKSSPKNW